LVKERSDNRTVEARGSIPLCSTIFFPRLNRPYPELSSAITMQRVLIAPQAVRGQEIAIADPGALHHLRRVLRVRPGDALECVDGTGRRYRGHITRCDAGEVTMAIDASSVDVAPRMPITLAQAMIRPERFEWVIEKSTELGVARILPMITSRTVRGDLVSRHRARVERWRRIAAAAAVQCGRSTVPALEEPCAFAEVFERLRGGRALLPTLAVQGRPLIEAMEMVAQDTALTVLIGPEGDFTMDEVQLAQRQGACAVRLGDATLRSETAAVALLAILQCRTGGW